MAETAGEYYYFGDNWPARANCRDDPDAMFVTGAAQNSAKQMCRDCAVRYACLADALQNRIEFGVWGGMTERERRALLKEHPDIGDWRRRFIARLAIGHAQKEDD